MQAQAEGLPVLPEAGEGFGICGMGQGTRPLCVSALALWDS